MASREVNISVGISSGSEKILFSNGTIDCDLPGLRTFDSEEETVHHTKITALKQSTSPRGVAPQNVDILFGLQWG